MRLSIIIPTLNEAVHIVATLTPLQAMRARGAEVIVIDGESADATTELAKPLADLVLHCPSAQHSRAVQMNLGAARASGDVLWFLHADTVVPPNADQLILGDSTGWGRFDIEISGASKMLPVVGWFMNYRSRLTGIATGDQALFVSREVFSQIGGYPDQSLMEDVEICKRLKKISPPRALPERVITSGRRWEKYGVWRTILLMWQLRLRYFFGASPKDIYLAYYGKHSVRHEGPRHEDPRHEKP
jgi:rSAM/selenodomain-associated transferase 2